MPRPERLIHQDVVCEGHQVIVRRYGAVILALAIVGAACADEDAVTTGQPAATSTSTSRPPTTATTSPATTTTEAPTTGTSLAVGVDAALTVANDDGAFLVEGDFVFQLVDGPVELAIADGSGGLVFQRSSDAGLRDPNATIISYLPSDSFEPHDLLVPTGDQYLKLRDVGDGFVWYTRTEGDNPDNARETLRSYGLENRTVDEFAVTGGWESGSIEVSAGGPNVVAYWHAEATSGFTYYAESGTRVGFEGDPYGADGFCADGQLYDEATNRLVGQSCYQYAELSDDGRLAYHQLELDGAEFRFIVVVVDLDTGAELFRREFERPDQGWVGKGMDLSGDQLIVNRTATGAYQAPYIDAFLINLSTGEVSEIGFDGQARFLGGPMGID